MSSDDDEDLLASFFSGKPIKENVNIKTVKTEFTTTILPESKKQEYVKREISNNNNIVKDIQEEEHRKILTHYLNAPVEELNSRLNIEEDNEATDIPELQIYSRYEFNSIPIQQLPIAQKRSAILNSINSHRVILIKATTGSGKSSQVPQYLLQDSYEKSKPCNIIITQPRRISAETLASRVALERRCELGSLVGYQIGLDKKMDSEETRILYCTTGVLLQKLVNQKSLKTWTHIIIDEVHERDIELDMTILILRRLMIAKNSDAKIILMSATPDVKKLCEYFKTIEPAPVLDLDVARPHQTQIDYLDSTVDESTRELISIDFENPGIDHAMYKHGVNVMKHLIRKGVKSFLVFLPGLYEINMFEKELSRLPDDMKKEYEIFKLHSTIPLGKNTVLYTQAIGNKIVLATNIAESSVTLPDIDFVIDYCLTKYLENDSNSNFSQLKLAWASKMNLTQRAGRVGRTKIGQVIRMIYQEFFNKLPDEPKPEIKRIPLENVILKAKQLNMGRPTDILALAIDPPSRSNIVDAILVLKENFALKRYNRLNGFDYLDSEITFVGKIMEKLPIDIRLSKLILLGHIFSVKDETIIIAAGLSSKSIFRNINHSIDSYEKYLKNDTTSDIVAILNVYKKWRKWHYENNHISTSEENKWCDKEMIDLKNIKEMETLISDIHKRLKNFMFLNDNFRFNSYDDKLFAIKLCIAGAFYPNFYLFGGTIPTKEKFKVVNNLNPCNTVYFKNMPVREVYAQIYDAQIKDYLLKNQVIKSEKDVIVTFDSNSNRVFVEFKTLGSNQTINMPGDVKLEVYKALRLKNLSRNEKLKLRTNLEEEIIPPPPANLGQRYEIYPVCDEVLVGKITHIVSLGKFYFQSLKAKNLMINMKNLLQKDNLVVAKDADERTKDDFIIVKYKDDFERGQIISEYRSQNDASKSFQVLLIDYGKTIQCKEVDFYTFKAVRQEFRKDLLSKYFHIQPLCIECKLTGIKPIAGNNGWSEKAIEEFRKIVNDKSKDFQLEVYSYNKWDKIASVYLLTRPKNTAHPMSNFNSSLKSKGYADMANESYITTLCKITGADQSNRKLNKTANCDILVLPKQKIELDGPFSPLEERTLEKTFRANEEKINVSSTSINGILLDPYPFDGIKKVIIPATKVKSNNGRIVLQKTTLMPHLAGIEVLFALIFSPYTEVRYNNSNTKCTSILCGLGCDFSGKPYFGEHDCLLNVDIELDDQDFHMINELRMIMSTLMNVEEQAYNQIFHDQSRTRACYLLMRVIKKERLKIGRMYDDFCWSEKSMKEYNNQLFPKINHNIFSKLSRNEIKQMNHIFMELDHKAKYNSKDDNTKCTPCDEDLGTLLELKVHVLQQSHLQLKEKYRYEVHNN